MDLPEILAARYYLSLPEQLLEFTIQAQLVDIGMI